MIWSRNFTVDELNSDRLNRNMSKHLDIQIEEITDSELKGSMPVDHRTMQPFDLLHGGASVVLAETLGSIASNLIVAETGKNAVGLHIEANHLRSVKTGRVFGHCQALKIGTKVHVWEIKIYDEKNKMVCASKLTTAVVERT